MLRYILSGEWLRNYVYHQTFRERNKIANVFVKEHNCPDLSVEEKREIDAYWQQYGIAFPNYSWHRMFYYVTGIHDKRFVPDPLLGMLYPQFNPEIYVKGLDDKNLYDTLCPTIKFPKTICHCVRGKLYDSEWNQILNIEQFADSLLDRKSVIIKKAKDSFAGQGVKKYNLIDSSLLEILDKYKKNNVDFIMQECVKQHPFLAQFNESSVNIFRIITWRYEGDIRILSVSLRFGEKGYATDVCYKDGKEIVNVVGVEKNGFLKSKVVGFDGFVDLKKNVTERIPGYDELIDSAIEGHKRLYQFDLVAWDFTIDEHSAPVCIEFNVLYPGSILYQFANGPFAGDYSEEFFRSLEEPSVRKRIPSKWLS